MLIRLSLDQQARLLEWARTITEAHVAAGCEPPGYELIINVAGPYGVSATASSGSSVIDLGGVSLDLTE
jgi:hypothetical protein